MDWKALARHLAGETPASERERVSAWLAEDPARQELVGALSRTLERMPAGAGPADLEVEEALQIVKSRMHETASAPVHSPPPLAIPSLRRPDWTVALRRAAIVAAVLFGGALVLRQQRQPAAGVAVARSHQTGVGQQDTLSLSDGSTVVLGPGSELTVAAGYGDDHREVGLAGTAFFQVVHDDERPFVVEAGRAVIRDIGTAFNVTTEADAVRVTVTEGSVTMRTAELPADSGVILRAGDRGEVAGRGPVVAERGAPVSEDLAWTLGRLVFRDATLGQVRADLRRWYGLELNVADSALASRHLTATFERDPPVQVVRVLAAALGATASMRGDTVFLTPVAGGGEP